MRRHDLDPLFRRIGWYADIGDNEYAALASIKGRREEYNFGEDLVSRGDQTTESFVIVEGWAARYITLSDGRMQVLNFMLPGDMFDLQTTFSTGADHSVVALTRAVAFHIPQRAVLSLFSGGTRAGAALWWCALQEEAMLREQIVRNGRRTARERIAHLLLELHRRALIVGEGDGDTFRLPVSQATIADALGLSFVHVSRTLSGLQKSRCIERKSKVLTITDHLLLRDIAGFTEDYLHLDARAPKLRFDTAVPAE